MTAIQRISTFHPCMSQIVVHNNTVYLSGQTCPSALGEQEDTSGTVAGQTRAILNRIDKLLALAGTDKTRILTANIWLKDMQADFAAMNQEWITWIDPKHKPVRATVQSTLSAPEMLVEIQMLIPCTGALRMKYSDERALDYDREADQFLVDAITKPSGVLRLYSIDALCKLE